MDVERALNFVVEDQREQWRQVILQNGKRVMEVYGDDLTRFSTITSWHHRDGYAAARVATPIPGDGTNGLYLILRKSSAGWRVVDLNDIKTSDRLKEKLDRFLQRASRKKE